MKYFHVDVFSSLPLAGNGLTVVLPEEELDSRRMLEITREFRQFETIFLYPGNNGTSPFRVFTLEEELDFAGHPAIGAAAVIHHIQNPADKEREIILMGTKRNISLLSRREGSLYSVVMNQGLPEFIRTLPAEGYGRILDALGLTPGDIHPSYPAEVISTGLPYLILPLRTSLDKAAIRGENFEKLLAEWGAKFVYLFDPDSLECRTWDNAGLVEDVATGSAAGPLCAYLVKNGYAAAGVRLSIHQGRFTGRPSIIKACQSQRTGEISIEGEVAFFAEGNLLL